MGGRGRGRERKDRGQSKIQEEREAEEMSDADAEGNGDQHVVAEALASISAEIRDLKREMKNNLSEFKDEFKTDIRQEFASFKEEINRKLEANNTEIQDQKKAIAEAQVRIGELEAWNMEVKDALVTSLKQQGDLQEKLTDLEGRSRRNTLRIFGVPEGTEGDSVPSFVEKLIQKELALPEGTSLQIQRAHRALAKKPPEGQTPRSIVVNFLQFDTKETIIRKAWQKRIQIDGKQLSFDHDYATEVIRKRKTYAGIKKVLKEKGIRFQTPLTKMRIHWANGPRTYDSAVDAAQDMRKRGLEIQLESAGDAGGPTLVERLLGASEWQRVGQTESDTVRRARERLQQYRNQK